MRSMFSAQNRVEEREEEEERKKKRGRKEEKVKKALISPKEQEMGSKKSQTNPTSRTS